jgi:hypothetical protein
MSNLYAEYLPNIKTLAITAVLETPRDDDTALWLTKDRTKLILQHADNSYRILALAKDTVSIVFLLNPSLLLKKPSYHGLQAL